MLNVVKCVSTHDLCCQGFLSGAYLTAQLLYFQKRFHCSLVRSPLEIPRLSLGDSFAGLDTLNCCTPFTLPL